MGSVGRRAFTLPLARLCVKSTNWVDFDRMLLLLTLVATAVGYTVSTPTITAIVDPSDSTYYIYTCSGTVSGASAFGGNTFLQFSNAGATCITPTRTCSSGVNGVLPSSCAVTANVLNSVTLRTQCNNCLADLSCAFANADFGLGGDHCTGVCNANPLQDLQVCSVGGGNE